MSVSWPARGPLGRLREARQGPAEAWTAPTKGGGRQEDYGITRVKNIPQVTLRHGNMTSAVFSIVHTQRAATSALSQA